MVRSKRSTPFFLGLPLVLVGLIATLTAWPGEDAESDPPPPPVNTELGFVLMRAGLDAEALAAAGVDAQTTTTVVTDAAAELDSDPGALAQADADYEAAKLTHDVLVRKVRSGLASTDEVSTCQSWRTSCETAESTRDGLLEDIFEAGIASLSTSQKDALRAIRRNRDWRLPVQYSIEDRTQRAWVDLGDALDTKRIHEQYDEPFPQEVQDSLATIDGDTDVSAAKVNVDTNLASVQTAWNAAATD